MPARSLTLRTRSATFRYFLDRDIVTRKVNETTRKAWGIIGKATKTTAERSMRKQGTKKRRVSKSGKLDKRSRDTTHSEPGKPPKYRTRALKDNIRFSYDPDTNALVIGPTKLATAPKTTKPITRGTGAALLEFGGRAYQISKQGKRLVFNMLPRPYMSTAWEKIRQKSYIQRALSRSGF